MNSRNEVVNRKPVLLFYLVITATPITRNFLRCLFPVDHAGRVLGKAIAE